MFCLKPPLPCHSHCLSTADCWLSLSLSPSLFLSCCNRPLKHAATCVDTHTHTNVLFMSLLCVRVRVPGAFLLFGNDCNKNNNNGTHTLSRSLSLVYLICGPWEFIYIHTHTRRYGNACGKSKMSDISSQTWSQSSTKRRRRSEERTPAPSRLSLSPLLLSLPSLWC